jgi:translation initiation factor 1A
MVRNIFGGKNAKKRAKKFVNNRNTTRQLEKKIQGQEYALLTKKLGDCRFDCLCSDGVIRVAHVPGKFRKRWWFQVQEYVLVSIRFGIDPSKCDILHKYNQGEVEQLRNEGLLIKIINDNDVDLEEIEEEEDEDEDDDENEVEIDISDL